jgi:uncharacterized protein YjiS (DUF1127 family)
MRIAHICGSKEKSSAVQHGTIAKGGGELGSCPTGKEPIMLLAILNFLRSWRRYNASVNELYRLGDRELADIGITRSDIPRIAWDNANR